MALQDEGCQIIAAHCLYGGSFITPLYLYFCKSTPRLTLYPKLDFAYKNLHKETL